MNEGTLNPRERSVLEALYIFLSDHPDVELVEQADLRVAIGRAMPRGFIGPILDTLESRDFVTRIKEDPFVDEYSYAITYNGLRIIEEIRANEIDNEAPNETLDDVWSPLPVEWKDEEALASAITSLEETLERVRGDNGFASSNPKAHAKIVWSLSAGIEGIKNKIPNLNEIKNLVISPLKWLTDNFAKSAIGELAKEAAKAVWRAMIGS